MVMFNLSNSNGLITLSYDYDNIETDAVTSEWNERNAIAPCRQPKYPNVNIDAFV